MSWLARLFAALGVRRSPAQPVVRQSLASLARSRQCEAGEHDECGPSAYQSTMQCRCECHRFTLRAKVVLRSATRSEIRAWLEASGPPVASGEWIHSDTAGSRLAFALAAPAAEDRDLVGWMPTASLRVEIRGWTKSVAVAFAREELRGLLQQHDGVAMRAAPRLDRWSVFDKGDLARGVNAHGVALESILE